MHKRAIVAFLFAFATLIPYAKAQASGEAKKNEVGLVIGATLHRARRLPAVFRPLADIDLQLKSRAGRRIRSPLEHK